MANMGVLDVLGLLRRHHLVVHTIIPDPADSRVGTVVMEATLGQHERALEILRRLPGCRSAELQPETVAFIRVVMGPEGS